MKRCLLMMLCLFLLGDITLFAQSRRPIDNKHPMWLIHIDVWNNADPQKIIDLIPADIKPYVCMNLSLSCQYDNDLKMHKMPQNAVQTYKSWASVCCRNNMWFTCQPASGGKTHIKDDDLDTFEYFFKNYKNFLGWNYAEQFWGFDDPEDDSSSSQPSRIALFAKLVEMSHNYGGFLTVSFCGNIWSHGLNPVGMLKRNANLLANCKKYPEAILFLYKYTTAGCWYNNESVTLAPFISGLAKNYGVRYDNCGWNGALGTIFGEDSNHGRTYPAAAGIPPVLEQMCLNGACVWDGPELIWTECFKENSRTTVSGYTRRNWTTYSSFDNVWVDMFRKVLDGTIYIPSREEVVERTKFALVSDVNQANDNTSLKGRAYATPETLYDGIYKQDDPFNRDNGQMDKNNCYYKKTGRYQTIPVLFPLEHCDDLAKSINTKLTRTDYDNNFGNWQNETMKQVKLNRLYPEVSQGDMFVARNHNELLCYTPYSYLNYKVASKASVPLQYNSCTSLELNFPRFSSAVVKEYNDRIVFYLNNFRSDTVAAVTDVIKVVGASSKPAYSYKDRVSTKSVITEDWNAETATYTCSVSHMGPLDLTIHCEGANVDDRSTDYLSDEPIAELPQQPTAYYGELVIEAEDMDYKNVKENVTHAYNSSYRELRGHSAMGFQVLGTSTAAALRNATMINFGGTYNVTVKYMSQTNAQVMVSCGSVSRKVLNLSASGETWQTVSFETTLKSGSNTFTLTNVGGKNVYIDNVTFTPLQLDDPIDEVWTDLMPEMFHQWSGVDATASDNGPTDCSYELNTESWLPYGDGNVNYLRYADLSDYATLEITVTQGTPRLLFNRYTDGGSYIGFEPDNAVFMTKVVANGNGTISYYYDLAAIKEQDGYVHLNAIKGVGEWSGADKPIVTAMRLTTSGIGTVEVPSVVRERNMPTDEIYDLFGRRVYTLVKGHVYIIGGKKVLYR